jgi:hypothetical protein
VGLIVEPPCPERQVGAGVIPSLDVALILKHMAMNCNALGIHFMWKSKK